MGANQGENLYMIGCIRRIVKDDVPGLELTRNASFEKFKSFRLYDLGLFLGNLTEIEIGFDQATHLPRAIHKRGVTCASREGFNTNGTRAGTEIEKPRFFDSRRNDIKQCLAQAVRGRPDLDRWRALQITSAVFTGNYSQWIESPNDGEAEPGIGLHSSDHAGCFDRALALREIKLSFLSGSFKYRLVPNQVSHTKLWQS